MRRNGSEDITATSHQHGARSSTDGSLPDTLDHDREQAWRISGAKLALAASATSRLAAAAGLRSNRFRKSYSAAALACSSTFFQPRPLPTPAQGLQLLESCSGATDQIGRFTEGICSGASNGAELLTGRRRV